MSKIVKVTFTKASTQDTLLAASRTMACDFEYSSNAECTMSSLVVRHTATMEEKIKKKAGLVVGM